MPAMVPMSMLESWKVKHRPSTAKNYRYELQIILTALHSAGAPAILLRRLPRPTARGVTASPEELVKLFRDPPAWLRLYMLLYFQCGLRSSETLEVTPRNWNRENGTVTIRVKGGRTRAVRISDDVAMMLHTAGDPDPDTPFLWTIRGRPLTLGGLRRAWERHKAKTGVNPNLTAHDLRRTSATIIYTGTKDLRAAQELLGHKNLTSVLAYLAPLHPDDARKYQELLQFHHFKSEVKQ